MSLTAGGSSSKTAAIEMTPGAISGDRDSGRHALRGGGWAVDGKDPGRSGKRDCVVADRVTRPVPASASIGKGRG